MNSSVSLLQLFPTQLSAVEASVIPMSYLEPTSIASTKSVAAFLQAF